MRRLLLIVPVLALTAGALSGCGSASDPAPAAAGPLSKADYVTQANDICTKAKTELAAIPRPTAPAQFETYLTSSVARAKKAATDLQALPAPAADAAELKAKLTDPLAGQVQAIEAVLPDFTAAAKSANPQKALAAIRPPALPRPDTAYLDAYGLKACSGLAQG